MKAITYFYLTHCPYCVKANRALEELCAENPAFAQIPIERIEESKNPGIAGRYSYYYVPTFFIGDEKVYEADPRQDYDAIKADVKRALETALAK